MPVEVGPPPPSDDAYGAGWNGSTKAPTQNTVYDQIESLSGTYVPRDLSTLTESTAPDSDDLVAAYVDGALRKVQMANLGQAIHSYARADRAATQSIADSTITLVDLDTSRVDSGSIVNLASDQLDLAAGTWIVGASVTWASNSTGSRNVIITEVGASTLVHQRSASSNGSQPSTVVGVVTRASSFAIELNVSQTSGGNLNVAEAQLWAVKIA